MTYKDRVSLYSFFLLMLILSSCTSNFDDLNTSRSQIDKGVIKPQFLFTNSQKDFIYDIPSLGVVDTWVGYEVNQAAGNVFLDKRWGWPYDNYLMNNEEAMRLTVNDPHLANEHAITRIWRVQLFSHVTDIFGDVPYSEALKSAENNNPKPKYDEQKNIYKSMLNNLKEAAANLKMSGDLASFGGADLIYNGKVQMWKRFANSLRLRLAMRARYADQQLAKNHISDVINKPLIENNSQNASFTTADSTSSEHSNRNPIYNSNIGASQPEWASFTITSLMNNRKDPRRKIYFHKADDIVHGYRGRPIAVPTDQQRDSAQTYGVETSAYYGELFTQSKYNIKIMQAAEVQFLKAEAYLTGLVSGNAQAAFQKGIRASMELYNVDEDSINNYITQGGTLPANKEKALQEIIVQKYIANFGLPYESWAEFRRTGYPKQYTGGVQGRTNGNIPRRKTYPDVEFSINKNHVQEAAERLGGDELMSRVWWDAKDGLPYNHPDQGKYPPSEYWKE